jgi:hypothetical protein
MTLSDNRPDNQIEYQNAQGGSKLVKTIQYNENGELVNTEQLNDTLILFRRLLQLADSLSTVDISNRQRVAVETIAGTTLGRAITGVDSGAGIPAPNAIAINAPSYGAPNAVYYQPVWVGPVDQRWLVKDQARNTYANAIRSNIV